MIQGHLPGKERKASADEKLSQETRKIKEMGVGKLKEKDVEQEKLKLELKAGQMSHLKNRKLLIAMRE